ncbi:MAG: dTDP-4-dehydrorhamnose 3,5-epimerase family protein [candidate division Zixibacteria bacterium]|nr:dTDP-4-dehydrorhamnose 3,5-epimerase family protein [candidate division Zixibacteria bacterium]
MIDGVRVKKLKVIPDERGKLMEILRADDDLFTKFGQVYITSVHPGVVKAWHCHQKQIDHFTCISGNIKLVLADLRPGSATERQTQEFFIGEDNPQLVQIPAGVHHGIKCIGDRTALALNVPNETYDHVNPDEQRLPFDTELIDYDWEIRHG